MCAGSVAERLFIPFSLLIRGDAMLLLRRRRQAAVPLQYSLCRLKRTWASENACLNRLMLGRTARFATATESCGTPGRKRGRLDGATVISGHTLQLYLDESGGGEERLLQEAGLCRRHLCGSAALTTSAAP